MQNMQRSHKVIRAGPSTFGTLGKLSLAPPAHFFFFFRPFRQYSSTVKVLHLLFITN